MSYTSPSETYAGWVTDPSPDNMSRVLESLAPTINSEVQRYSGPKPVLRARAKLLAVDAVRSYKPDQGAKLTSWLTTQLQPLNRYGREMSEPVKVGETSYRQYAALRKAQAELEDELDDVPSDEQLADRMGIPAKRIEKIRMMNQAYQYEGAAADAVAETGIGGEAVAPIGTRPEVADAVEMVYASLSDRDKIIYDLKTGGHGKRQVDNKTIARRLGVSPAYISQRSATIGQMIAGAAQGG